MNDEDIIGYDDEDIIGYDDDDDEDDDLDVLAGEEDDDFDVEIGARRRSRGRGRGGASKRMRRARAIDPNAVLVRRGRRGPRKRKVLPAPTTNIAPGATVTIEIETQELFRPERLVFPVLNIEDFIIRSLTVGTENQFATSGDCPASVFAPDAVDVAVHFKTANVGNKISVTIQNINAAALDCRFAFIGTSLT